MTLLSSLQLGKNALFASQIGLHVAGSNIANANTPGYIRQDVVFAPAPTQRIGNLLLGLGVEVQGIVQRTDRFLEEQTRTAKSDVANGDLQRQAYLRLEGLLGELTDTDLSTALTGFFGTLQDVANQPENLSVRNLAVLKGESLTQDINRLASRVTSEQTEINNQIVGAGQQINEVVNRLGKLNIQIANLERGDPSRGAAASLRQDRTTLLGQLSELVDIRTEEQESGTISVYSGGDFLVIDGNVRQVEVVITPQGGRNLASIQLDSTNSPLQAQSGKVAGLVAARDDVYGEFLNDLDEFSRTLAYEFNRVHSSGQGLVGLQEVTSEFSVTDSQRALDDAGLPFVPDNGSLQVIVHNKFTGLTKTTDVFVRLRGLDDDTSLTDFASDLDAIDGLSATITPQGKLSLKSESADLEFSFANETSGALAALGINTFFSGSTASTLHVNPAIRAVPGRLAASQGGIGVDSENIIALAGMLDRPLESGDGASLMDLFDRVTAETAQSSAVAKSVADGYQAFHDTLDQQLLAMQGVSLDEEAVRIIAHQRAFQASARFIAAVSEVLDILVSL